MNAQNNKPNHKQKVLSPKGIFLALVVLLCLALVACVTSKPNPGNTGSSPLPASAEQGVIVGGPQVLQPEWRASTLGLMTTTARMSGGVTSRPECRSLPYGSQISNILCQGTSKQP